MIARDHDLPISRQAAFISRGSVYSLPKPVSDADLALMRRIDELHLEHPFMGARLLRRQLRQEGVKVGRRHVSTLMKKTGIEALAPQPGTSQRAPGEQDLSLSVAQGFHRPIQSGVGAGYHLHSHGARVRLPHRRGGRGQPPGIGAQGGDHAGGVSRQRSDRCGLCPLRHA